MRRWIAWAGRLYPPQWREEYGPEFEALLEDVRPGWRVFADVLRGAIRMQLTMGKNVVTVAAATAVAGAILAGGLSFAAPKRYVSSAVLQIVPLADPIRKAPAQVLQERAADHLTQMQTEILSRGSLSEVIQKPSLDLYKTERQRMPMEDVVQQMRRDIRIEPLPDRPEKNGLAAMPFRLSFAYPDQVKAQAVLRELVVKFVEQNVTLHRNRASLYGYFWQDEAKAHQAPPPPPPPVGQNLEVVEPARLPSSPLSPNRLGYVGAGLGAGLAAGLLAVASFRRPRTMALLAGGAAAGCALAFAGSFLLAERYTSSAVLRITPPQVTEDPLAMPPTTPVAARLAHLTPSVLSSENLGAIVRNPRLELYAKERASRSLAEVIQTMRDRDIQIELPRVTGPGAPSAFRVSFSHPDRRKAQAVVRELVTSFVEVNIREARAANAEASPIQRDIEEHKAGENLEVLDPASLPESAVAPDRVWIAGAGGVVGLLFGGVWLRMGRRSGPPPPLPFLRELPGAETAAQ